MGIQEAAIGEKFLEGIPWELAKEKYTIINGETVKITGQALIVFRLASSDCHEMMAASVKITPDLDGLVLGMEWIHENACMWNTKTGQVHTIDDIVFHADYDRDASLVNRVSPLPDSSAVVGLVSAMALERPMEQEQLGPIRVCGVVEPERPVPLEELLPI